MDDLRRQVRTKIGTSYDGMADTKIEPIVEWFDNEYVTRGGCGGDAGNGNPRCRWTYPNRRLTGEQYYQLRSIVGNALSATVFIQTPTMDVDTTAYLPLVATYEAIMRWPASGIRLSLYNEWEFPDEGLLFNVVISYA